MGRLRIHLAMPCRDDFEIAVAFTILVGTSGRAFSRQMVTAKPDPAWTAERGSGRPKSVSALGGAPDCREGTSNFNKKLGIPLGSLDPTFFRKSEVCLGTRGRPCVDFRVPEVGTLSRHSGAGTPNSQVLAGNLKCQLFPRMNNRFKPETHETFGTQHLTQNNQKNQPMGGSAEHLRPDGEITRRTRITVEHSRFSDD